MTVTVPPELTRYMPGCTCRDRVKLRALVQRNGIRQYAIYCYQSGWRGSFIPKVLATQVADLHGCHLDDIPVWQDNRPGCCDGSGCENCVDTACEHCGSYTAVQWHHWAPWHLFGADANDWPISPLCAICHRHWHAIVTPNIHARQAS